MTVELMSLGLSLASTVAGAARCRDHRKWDHLSLGLACSALFLGFLFLLGAAWERPGNVVPLSLILLMFSISFLYRNFFIVMLGLPLLVAEQLLILTLPEIMVVFAQPLAFCLAFILHSSFFVLMLILLPTVDRPYNELEKTWSPYVLAASLFPFRRPGSQGYLHVEKQRWSPGRDAAPTLKAEC